MRAHRAITIATAFLALACTNQNANQQTASGAAGGKSLPEVTDADLTRADLAMFGTLPARMDVPGQPSTEAQVALGRTLYYENVLSEGHDVSCNSCHPLNAFGADGRRVSFGHKGQLGSRNSPTVYNAAAEVAQFWDGRAPTVEEQAKGPILNPAEMGMPNSAAVLEHLKASPKYRAAFAAAYAGQSDPVTYDNVGRAIGAFERGLVTPSRWDAFQSGDSSVLTIEEKRGIKTFIAAGCASCHGGSLVGGRLFQKAGLRQPWPSVADSGRIALTHNASDLYVFKVPSLRNVEMTSPYFSDGSIASLDSAIVMMGRHQLGIELSARQVGDIHAWLRTLTGTIPVAYVAEPPLPRKAE
jgi:cytochrome c peroxidase